MTTITPRQLHERLQQGEKLQMLDIRTPAVPAVIHVPGAHPARMPWNQSGTGSSSVK